MKTRSNKMLRTPVYSLRPGPSGTKPTPNTKTGKAPLKRSSASVIELCNISEENSEDSERHLESRSKRKILSEPQVNEQKLWKESCLHSGPLLSGKENSWDYNWDRRDPVSLVQPLTSTDNPAKRRKYEAELLKNKSTATRYIFLIRHAQYNANSDQKNLTSLGERQAELTGARLGTLNLPFKVIIHSTQTRAIETATLIEESLNVPMASCPMLIEGYPCPSEPPTGHWKSENMYFVTGARIEAAFREYMFRALPSQKTNSYEIIVCHSNVIRYFICRALQISPVAWSRFVLNHCSITQIAIKPDGTVQLRSVGDSGHLDSHFLTA